MAIDPGPLVLVLDLPYAPKVLAWWERVRPGGEPDLDHLALVVQAPRETVAATLEACRTAGLLEGPGGGVSDVARRWLSMTAAQALGITVADRKPDKVESRGGLPN